MKSSTKKWLIPTVIIAVIAIVLYRGTAGVNNNAVDKQEEAQTKWSNVESAYQRRSDLIPNLVNTVEGAADFEKSTLKEVMEARSKATSVNVNADDLDQKSVQKFQDAQNGLSSALSRLMVSVERYPDIKATDNFQSLQSQLEGTENRINVARNRYNDAVKDYNRYIRHFPQNITAGMLGFDKMTRFEADKGAEEAPDVDFGEESDD